MVGWGTSFWRSTAAKALALVLSLKRPPVAMVRVEMLAVGKELLIGRTLNTNAHWVGGRLARRGSMLKEVMTVDDDLDEISSAMKDILRRVPDFLIVVGGLGPTPDDMTLAGLARALGAKLKSSNEALGLIKEHYRERGLGVVELTPARRKMAVLPDGAKPVPNRQGTAPGVRLMAGSTVVYALPGVPKEMKGIFKDTVEPEIVSRLGRLHREYLKFKLQGIMESVLAPLISVAMERHPGVYIKSHPRGLVDGISRIELDIAVVGADKKKAVEEAIRTADEILGKVKKMGAIVKSVKGSARRGTT
jgi:nicotinamide-nucleotide amidase